MAELSGAMDDLLQEFLAETADGLAAFDRDLERLTLEPGDPEPLHRLSRFIRTIRGTCGFLDLPRLAALSRAAEGALAGVRGAPEAASETVGPILDALERIRAILAALQATGREPAGLDAELLQRLRSGVEAGGTDQEDRGAVAAPVIVPVAKDEQSDGRPLDSMPVAVPAVRTADAAGRMDLDLLETLRHKAAELTLTCNHLLQVLRDRPEQRIAEPLQHLGQLATELQEDIGRARLQPAAFAWPELPGLVAELAARFGKQIDFRTTGDDIPLDCQLVASMRDALAELVRNAAEHGIEAPARRRAGGKPETGTIRLDVGRDGGTVTLVVSDDGRGFAPGRIKAMALVRGVADVAEVETLPSSSARDLLFRPNLPAITGPEPRGGLDVVGRAVARLGGTAELTSGEAEGTSLTLRLPASFTVMPAVILESAGECYALPQLNLLETVPADRQNVDRSEDEPLLRFGGGLLPLTTLRELLALDATGPSGDGFVAVLRAGSYRFGLVVDAVLGHEDILVSPLPPPLRDIAVLGGCAVLGDGRPVLVLDPGGLAAAGGGIGKRLRAGADAGQPASGCGELALLLFRTAGDPALKGVPLPRLARVEEVDLPGDSELPGTNGRRIALVFATGTSKAALVVEEVVDIVEGRVSVDIATSRPGTLGRAVVSGRPVEIIDVTHYLDAAAVGSTAMSPGDALDP